MRFLAIDGNRQRLDGGAMYGNAPRALWETWSPPDARNRIELACRALFVEFLYRAVQPSDLHRYHDGEAVRGP